jgi:hypothetical protein
MISTNLEFIIDELEAPLFECGPGHFTQGYGFVGYIRTKNSKNNPLSGEPVTSEKKKEKLKLREQALLILLSRYGTELDNTRKSKYTEQSIYECAHDWVSQGYVNCNGITKYYEAYYAKSN